MQVYDYLEKTPAGQQTRKNVVAFFTATEQYKLTKAEQLQASNLRPASAVEVHLVRCLTLLCFFSLLLIFLFCELRIYILTALRKHAFFHEWPSRLFSFCSGVTYNCFLLCRSSGFVRWCGYCYWLVVQQIVEDCDERLSSEAVDKFLGTIEEILPPIPEPEEPAAEDDPGEEAEPEGDEMDAKAWQT